MPISRRALLEGFGAAGPAVLLGNAVGAADGEPLRIAGRDVELTVTAAGPATVRITVTPIEGGHPQPVPSDGSLVRQERGEPTLRLTSLEAPRTADCAGARVTVSNRPLTVRIEAPDGRLIQRLVIDATTGAFGFHLGDAPVLGLGEGGRQFDRRGAVDRMRSGQGGYRLRTHGGRVPVPWLIGTAGWAMFVHRPYGTFDLSGSDGRFSPGPVPLPIDVLVVTAREPRRVMAEYAALTGLPEMPPLWTLGYQQSHRTLASREEVLSVARTFREKRLPCDALIYLGTGFCPSGWNTGHGSFTFNPTAFPDPKAMLDEMHALGFHVVPHVVIRARSIRGTVHDRPDTSGRTEVEGDAARYWDAHRKIFALGVDGWWPDEGDPLDPASRLTRIRMYWDGPQLDRPNARPYALHRNGYAGMQRYGAFLWSGDVYSTWETLRAHVPVAVNTGLTGIPYWGTDTGGFVPTKELTGELYVRWFQFSAFCPLFRSHGRTWKLRLPWGWNTGELGPDEIRAYGDTANPDPSELHNAAVEPICRKYLELRYRLLPYLYSAVREAHTAGLPIIRALWLHHADDPQAVARGDQYLWGRDILVAPVIEKGATARTLYLPRGTWHDFWTGERLEGGREVRRPVDLETIPLYVRAGAMIPLGPVRQSTSDPANGPLTLSIYPGADGDFLLYEDDGISFGYRSGDWTGIALRWDDRDRRLTMHLAPGSRLRPPGERRFAVRIAPGDETRTVVFAGEPVEMRW